MTGSTPNWKLQLLGFWQLRRDGEPTNVGGRQQRVIAALAVLGPQPRPLLAGTLWPEATEERAAGNLRTSVFRISHDLPYVITERSHALAIDERVQVDLSRLSRRLVRADPAPEAGIADTLLRAELLPGWYEDWVLYEQERWRSARIAALESLAGRHLQRSELPAALAAVRAAIALDPLRENPRVLLIRALLADGDPGNAVKAERAYRAELADALGSRPSAAFDEVVASLRPHSAARGPVPSRTR